MDIADSARWGDAVLLRPAVDPAIPRAARQRLTAPGTPLAHVREGRRNRGGILPVHPERRQAIVDDAVTGLTAAMFVVVTGAAPWAVGVLVFQGPVGWQSATGRYALLLSELIVVVTAVVFGSRVARFGELRGRSRVAAAARRYHGRYLTGADLDGRGRTLLRRAQDAADAVCSADVTRAGLLDEVRTEAALAAQEWDIALALREQARLRARRAELGEPAPGSAATRLLDQHRDAARAADESIASRVAALEQYAAEVRRADAAYRQWRQHAAVAGLTSQHLDMLARTAADEHGIAELTAMTRQARDVRQAFSDPATGSQRLAGNFWASWTPKSFRLTVGPARGAADQAHEVVAGPGAAGIRGDPARVPQPGQLKLVARGAGVGEVRGSGHARASIKRLNRSNLTALPVRG